MQTQEHADPEAPAEGDTVTIRGTPGRWTVEVRSLRLHGYDGADYRIRCRPIGGGEKRIFDAHLATPVDPQD